MRIGILGGTFNPVHIGHLILAEAAKDALGLDKVIFVPCYLPPHKGRDVLIKPELRLAMLRSAVRGKKHFIVDTLELKRKGISYTIDTAVSLKRKYPKDSLFLIIGSDLHRDFAKWQKHSQLKKIVKIVVALREDIPQGNRSVFFLKIPRIAISSSYIRQRVKEQESIEYLVPKSVQTYIKKHRIYR